ncbi:MAG: tRNA (adenosine(37)-N6)-threonylcarbamoyltransferase complex dimerization subunit type 1 TsaB [Candidatus Marinimicrobia bacterium]|nr:tRNA (adenosine(37)-N6)-threonylcarbamoyltransferase complex dimerization subunit type 1 TsaB [Candidatus Neomarinimicrobiota bacterium]MCF7840496.1 tRNA (adenosine(37)-N6)-threonylcarbamoyltransferase complex dimerization subunit type 1 TsaB [Candidatus Neomarinimicrobiota bacterium]
MNILAVETSTAVCSVALLSEGTEVYHRSLTGQQVHIENLATMLRQAVVKADLSQLHIDGLAIGIGPGSFTGLRIGLATIKAFGLVKELPLIPVPTLDALALQYIDSQSAPGKTSVLGVLFSHRNFVHTARFDLASDEPTRGDYTYGTLEDLTEIAVNTAWFGPASPKVEEWRQSQTTPVDFSVITPDARSIARLAEMRWSERIWDYGTIEPFYNTIYQAKKWQRPTFDPSTDNSER